MFNCVYTYLCVLWIVLAAVGGIAATGFPPEWFGRRFDVAGWRRRVGERPSWRRLCREKDIAGEWRNCREWVEKRRNSGGWVADDGGAKGLTAAARWRGVQDEGGDCETGVWRVGTRESCRRRIERERKAERERKGGGKERLAVVVSWRRSGQCGCLCSWLLNGGASSSAAVVVARSPERMKIRGGFAKRCMYLYMLLGCLTRQRLRLWVLKCVGITCESALSLVNVVSLWSIEGEIFRTGQWGVRVLLCRVTTSWVEIWVKEVVAGKMVGWDWWAGGIFL